MKQKSRLILLASVAIATTFTLGTTILRSPEQSLQVTEYNFPDAIALTKWDLLFTKPVNPNLVKPPASISGNFVAGKHYRYRQNEQYLAIEMRYLINTDGDLKSFVTSQTGELATALKQDSDGGFYSIHSDEDKAYLNACINPRGGSTVTSDRFKRNRLIYDTRVDRVLPWLLGETELQDKRCLWAYISLSLDPNLSLEDNYRTLETVWTDWHSYWRSHFPQP